jgi:hypothetical protein
LSNSQTKTDKHCIGDFVEGKSGKVADPYVQLLPLTDDLAEAHSDFVSVRLKGVDSTGGQTLLSNVTASGPPDPTYSGSQDSGFVAYVKKHKWIFIGVAIGVGVLLLGLILALCFCRRGNGKRKYMRGVSGQPTAYRQLHDPAPAGDSHYEYQQPYPNRGSY